MTTATLPGVETPTPKKTTPAQRFEDERPYRVVAQLSPRVLIVERDHTLNPRLKPVTPVCTQASIPGLAASLDSDGVALTRMSRYTCTGCGESAWWAHWPRDRQGHIKHAKDVKAATLTWTCWICAPYRSTEPRPTPPPTPPRPTPYPFTSDPCRGCGAVLGVRILGAYDYCARCSLRHGHAHES